MAVQFPRWVNPQSRQNLREVAPGLYVGAVDSPGYKSWSLVIDLYGTSEAGQKGQYRNAANVAAMPFEDGEGFPIGVLDGILRLIVPALRQGPVLIHCAAGKSRSVSAAYAMLRVLWHLPHEVALARVKSHPASRFPMDETLRSAQDWVARHRATRATPLRA